MNQVPACLGYANKVYEETLGEEKYTFVEECRYPQPQALFSSSCSLSSLELSDTKIYELYTLDSKP